jgi:hypothetical protein
MPIKELGMIQTDKKFYSTKNKCQNKICKCTASALIFGLTSQLDVLKDMEIKKVDSFKFIVKYFKK